MDSQLLIGCCSLERAAILSMEKNCYQGTVTKSFSLSLPNSLLILICFVISTVFIPAMFLFLLCSFQCLESMQTTAMLFRDPFLRPIGDKKVKCLVRRQQHVVICFLTHICHRFASYRLCFSLQRALSSFQLP